MYRDEADEQWHAIDSFLAESLVPPDDVLDEVLRASDAAGLPAIQVNPLQARLLTMLAKAGGGRRVLEVGTLGGYSTVWLARTVGPDGHVTTVEADERFAAVARGNLDSAGIGDRVTIEVGDGVEVVTRLAAPESGTEPFDLVFLDVDRVSNTALLPLAVELSHERAFIVIGIKDLMRETRRITTYLETRPDLMATAIQAVGSDGFHGFLLVTRV